MKKVFMTLAFAAMLFASVSCACGNCKKGEAAAEEAVAEIEAIFSQPDFHVKYGKQTAELTQKLNDAKNEVERLYARWDELEKIKNGTI